MGLFDWLTGKKKESRKIAVPSSSKEVTAEQAYQQGVACMHNDDWQTALGHLLTAAELDNEHTGCWYGLGLVYAKTSPDGNDEEQHRNHAMKMCSAFEKAMNLSDKHGGLEPNHYRMAGISSGTVYRVEKNYDQAIAIFERVMDKVSDDPEIILSLALCYFETGALEKAEEAVGNLLHIQPDSEQGRKLWKQIRKKADKGMDADLPEEKRQEIYSSYMSIQDNELLLKSDLLERTRQADNLGQMAEVLDTSAKQSGEKAREKIIESFGISNFELDLIINEGKRNAWPTSSVVQLAADHPQPQREKFRDSLQCVNCGKRNVASFWPEGGDMAGFYYQSEERTKEQPGAFRLPITCPFCNQTWFVVWDTSPDPLSEQFIRHIERMCEEYASKEQAVKAFRDLIDDRILGEHITFIKKELKDTGGPQQLAQHSITAEEYYSTLTIVPASDPHEIRRCLGGSYFEYLDPILSSADMDRWNTVHWILGIDDVTVGVHMSFLPKKSEIPMLPNIVPVDILTPEERAQLGL